MSGAEWRWQEDNAPSEHFKFQPHRRIRFSLRFSYPLSFSSLCSLSLSRGIPLPFILASLRLFGFLDLADNYVPGPYSTTSNLSINVSNRSLDSALRDLHPSLFLLPLLSFFFLIRSFSLLFLFLLFSRSRFLRSTNGGFSLSLSCSLTPPPLLPSLFCSISSSRAGARRCRSSVDVTLCFSSDSGSETDPPSHCLFLIKFTRMGHVHSSSLLFYTFRIRL